MRTVRLSLFQLMPSACCAWVDRVGLRADQLCMGSQDRLCGDPDANGTVHEPHRPMSGGAGRAVAVNRPQGGRRWRCARQGDSSPLVIAAAACMLSLRAVCVLRLAAQEPPQGTPLSRPLLRGCCSWPASRRAYRWWRACWRASSGPLAWQCSQLRISLQGLTRSHRRRLSLTATRTQLHLDIPLPAGSAAARVNIDCLTFSGACPSAPLSWQAGHVGQAATKATSWLYRRGTASCHVLHRRASGCCSGGCSPDAQSDDL